MIQLPVQAPCTESSLLTARPQPPKTSAGTKVCQVAYHHGMCRDVPPSLEARVAGIEATQHSMLNTLSELSSSIAQLVTFLTSADVKKGEKIPKDKCSSDKHMSKRRSQMMIRMERELEILINRLFCRSERKILMLKEVGEIKMENLKHSESQRKSQMN